MRALPLLFILLIAGCTSSTTSPSVLVQVENASSEGKTLFVNIDELAGKRVDRFQLTAEAGENASHRADVPDIETVLVSVEADGKVVGAKSLSPKDCKSSDPFRIQVSESGAVTILGKRC